MIKKGLLLVGIFLAFAGPFALPSLAHAYTPPNIWNPGILKGPIISCTGNPDNFDAQGLPTANPNACKDLCDLVYTIINIIYFAIAAVLWILAPIILVIGGVMYMMAGASPEMVGKGKKTLTGTIIGIIIVLCSWLIINTFITFLGIAGIGGFGNNSVCTVAAPPATAVPTP